MGRRFLIDQINLDYVSIMLTHLLKMKLRVANNNNNKKVSEDSSKNLPVPRVSLDGDLVLSDYLEEPDLITKNAMFKVPVSEEECLSQIHNLKITIKNTKDNKIRNTLKNHLYFYNKLKSAYSTRKILKSRSDTLQHVYRESSEVIENAQQKEDVAITGDTANVPNNSGFNTHLKLDNFFCRPVQILNFDVLNAPRGSIVQSFRPYALWSVDPSVRAKLKTYAFFRGNLTLRFVINGTRFHFGSLLAAWFPLHRYQDVYKGYVASTEPLGASLVNYASQAPENVMMYVGETFTFEMKCPFVCPTNSVRLYNTDRNLAIADGEVYDDLDQLGEVAIISVNPIKTFNTSSAEINIQVYAYCDDIQLGPPTATELVIGESGEIQGEIMSALQKMLAPAADKARSSKAAAVVNNTVQDYVADEYADAGPATKVASAVANVSGKLSNVPVIGDIAKTTNFVATKAAKVFSYFGFSKPVNIDPVQSYHPRMVENTAFFSGKDSTNKLSCDPKQELSIIEVGGEYGKDVMSISHICSRRSLFHTFPWNVADIPLTDTLFTVDVNPVQFTRDDTTTQFTAMGFAAYPFEYWRGTISYHFRAAASRFHTGKLLIIYEPNKVDLGLIQDATNTMNQQYYYIFDLATDREVIIDVGFVHRRNFASTCAMIQPAAILSRITERNGDILALSPDIEEETIGSIYVKPLVNLLGGDDVDSEVVEINVSAFSDDIEFAKPREFLDQQLICALPESGEIIKANFSSAPGNPSRCDRILINKFKHDPNDDSFLLHFGEKVLSFRSVLKRYFTESLVELPDPSFGIPRFLLEYVTKYPVMADDLIPLTNVSGLNTDGVQANDVFTSNLFNYLRNAYVGMRGSMRYKVQVHSPLEDTFNYTLFASNPQNKRGSTLRGVNFRERQVGANNRVGALISAGGLSTYGSAFTDSRVNPILEYEVPFYSADLFVSTSGYSRDTFFDLFSNVERGSTLNLVLQRTSTTVNDPLLSRYAAIGEDFSFIRFQGAVPFQPSSVALTADTTYSFGP